MDTVRQVLRTREALLWAMIEDGRVVGAALSEIYGKTAYAALVGGAGWSRWGAELTAAAETWARAAGCASLEFDGRPGWTRIMARHGYKPSKRGRYKMFKEL